MFSLESGVTLSVGDAVPRGASCPSEPQSKRALGCRAVLSVASPLARVPILLVTYSPQSEGSQRAGDPASDPTNA